MACSVAGRRAARPRVGATRLSSLSSSLAAMKLDSLLTLRMLFLCAPSCSACSSDSLARARVLSLSSRAQGSRPSLPPAISLVVGRSLSRQRPAACRSTSDRSADRRPAYSWRAGPGDAAGARGESRVAKKGRRERAREVVRGRPALDASRERQLCTGNVYADTQDTRALVARAGRCGRGAAEERVDGSAPLHGAHGSAELRQPSRRAHSRLGGDLRSAERPGRRRKAARDEGARRRG